LIRTRLLWHQVSDQAGRNVTMMRRPACFCFGTRRWGAHECSGGTRVSSVDRCAQSARCVRARPHGVQYRHQRLPRQPAPSLLPPPSPFAPTEEQARRHVLATRHRRHALSRLHRLVEQSPPFLSTVPPTRTLHVVAAHFHRCYSPSRALSD